MDLRCTYSLTGWRTHWFPNWLPKLPLIHSVPAWMTKFLTDMVIYWLCDWLNDRLITDRMTDLLIDRLVDWVTYCLQNTEFLTCVSNAALNVQLSYWANLTKPHLLTFRFTFTLVVWLTNLPIDQLTDWYI